MATRKPQGPTTKFIVLSNLSHDNDLYAPGDTVELTEAQALALPSGVVEPAPTDEAPAA